MSEPLESKGKLERTKLLEEAIRIVGGDRAQAYGGPEKNHDRIAVLWEAYLHGRNEPDRGLTGADVAVMMILLKVARLQNNLTHRDSWLDIAGYAAVGFETLGVNTDEPHQTEKIRTDDLNAAINHLHRFARLTTSPTEAADIEFLVTQIKASR